MKLQQDEESCLMVRGKGEEVGVGYDLQRFIDAQEGVYEQVGAELRQGRKTSHWIWFIFPQIAGLGQSAMAVRYAIGSLGEARAYLEHPVLGARLRECCGFLLEFKGEAIERIMGWPDDMKLKSSMTLFCQAAAKDDVFLQVLEAFFRSERDELTLARLEGGAAG